MVWRPAILVAGGIKNMDVNSIIRLIKEHRERFFDAQIAGVADDPLVATRAEVYRAIADEYDELLSEIEKQ